MSRSRRDLLWLPAFAILVAFAVPWPLWGVDRVVAGIPVWIWWHVGWLGLCTVLFSRFVASGAWERGMGLTPETEPIGDRSEPRGRTAGGGEEP